MVNMDNFLWDKSLSRFFATPPTPLANKATANLLQKGAYSSKNLAHTAGSSINNITYKAAQAVGTKMVTARAAAEAAKLAGTKASLFGKLLVKSKALTTLSEGLSKMGTKTGMKMSGVGTLFGIGFALNGIYKVGKNLVKGEFKAAGHELIKSTGAVAGCMAGMAMFVPGMGFFAGLALAMGADTAISWTTEKFADMLFPSVAAKNKAQEQAEKLKQSYTEAYQKTKQQDPIEAWRNRQLKMYG